MEAIEALALVGGHVDEELLVRNEYLAMENRILKSKIQKPVQFKDSERIQLAYIMYCFSFTSDQERFTLPG